jgi:hypothetical protein
VIAALERHDLTAGRVGLQLYPDNPTERLLKFLKDAGAESDPVLPYVYVSEAASHASPNRGKSEHRFELLTVQCRMARANLPGASAIWLWPPRYPLTPLLVLSVVRSFAKIPSGLSNGPLRTPVVNLSLRTNAAALA